MPVTASEKLAENEAFDEWFSDTCLTVFEMLHVVLWAVKFGLLPLIFAEYFPYSHTSLDYVQSTLEQAYKFLDEDSVPITFHMDASGMPGAPWIRIVNCQGCESHTSAHKHIYLTPSMWSRGSGLHQKLRIGAKWKDLICRESVMLHAILQSLDLGAATPREHFLPLNYLDKYKGMSDEQIRDHTGFDPAYFDRGRPCKIRGLRLCEEAAKDSRLRDLTLTNAESFVWFIMQAWAIIQGYQIVKGVVIKQDFIDTSRQWQETRDALPGLVQDYMEAGVV